MSPRASAKGLAKRQEILRVALEVFGADGFESASLREIARRCNLSNAGVLHYFESKEQLFVEVLRSRDAQDQQLFQEEAKVWGYGAAFERQVRRNADTPGLIALFVAMASEAGSPRHPATSFFRERYQRMRGFLTGYIQALGVETANGLSHDQAATLAISVLDGIQLQWLADPSLDMYATIQQGMAAIYRIPDRLRSPTTAHTQGA